uniref:Uncharacterized protein n=1 Tax=Trichuris muris TaxID=70415 RepID=A0A5S6QU27_TRIMR
MSEQSTEILSDSGTWKMEIDDENTASEAPSEADSDSSPPKFAYIFSDLLWSIRITGDFHEFAMIAIASLYRQKGHDVDPADVIEYFNFYFNMEFGNQVDDDFIPEHRPGHKGFTLAKSTADVSPRWSLYNMLHGLNPPDEVSGNIDPCNLHILG